MNATSTVDYTPQSATPSDHARWLALARLGVTLTAVLALAFFAVSLPSYFVHVIAPCPASPCLNDQLLPADAAKLTARGISLQAYALYLIVLQSVYVLVTTSVVFLLLWHRSSHGFALFTALTLVAWIFFVVDAPSVLADASPAWDPVLGVFALASFPLFTVFLFLFPSGRFAAPWARWLAAALVLTTVAFFAVAHARGNVSIVSYLAIFAVWFSAILGMQVYRYRRVSTPAERQQTKWVVYGLTVSLLGFVLLLAAQAIAGTERASLPDALLSGLYYPVEVLIPLSIGVAVLRSRLYDIDVIIRRTLVYGSLTTILVAVYAAGIVGLQAFIGGISGRASEQQPLLVVATTLLIVVLFRPLRIRLQRLIDRRFYRRRYDAARTLADFGAALRQDIDLAELREHLVGAVVETMQPTHTSLWLRPPPHRETEQP